LAGSDATLERRPRRLDPQPLNGLGRPGAQLGLKTSCKMPRAHAAVAGQIIDRQSRRQVTADIVQQFGESTVGLFHLQQG
jgi:hypothetical protein